MMRAVREAHVVNEYGIKCKHAIGSVRECHENLTAPM